MHRTSVSKYQARASLLGQCNIKMSSVLTLDKFFCSLEFVDLCIPKYTLRTRGCSASFWLDEVPYSSVESSLFSNASSPLFMYTFSLSRIPVECSGVRSADKS